MPYQITNKLPLQKVEELTNSKLVNFLEWQNFEHINATEFFPVITNEFNNIIQFFKWGLVPVWAKSIAMGLNMTKTKKENLLEKTALQAIYRYKRCVIPVSKFSVFIDAKKTSTMEFAAPENSVYYLIGLWDVWGEGLQTFSILTDKQLVKEQMVDMPIAIKKEKIPLWLSRKEASLSMLEKLI